MSNHHCHTKFLQYFTKENPIDSEFRNIIKVFAFFIFTANKEIKRQCPVLMINS
jgi:hypothetical protein